MIKLQILTNQFGIHTTSLGRIIEIRSQHTVRDFGLWGGSQNLSPIQIGPMMTVLVAHRPISIDDRSYCDPLSERRAKALLGKTESKSLTLPRQSMAAPEIQTPPESSLTTKRSSTRRTSYNKRSQRPDAPHRSRSVTRNTNVDQGDGPEVPSYMLRRASTENVSVTRRSRSRSRDSCTLLRRRTGTSASRGKSRERSNLEATNASPVSQRSYDQETRCNAALEEKHHETKDRYQRSRSCTRRTSRRVIKSNSFANDQRTEDVASRRLALRRTRSLCQQQGESPGEAPAERRPHRQSIGCVSAASGESQGRTRRYVRACSAVDAAATTSGKSTTSKDSRRSSHSVSRISAKPPTCCPPGERNSSLRLSEFVVRTKTPDPSDDCDVSSVSEFSIQSQSRKYKMVTARTSTSRHNSTSRRNSLGASAYMNADGDPKDDEDADSAFDSFMSGSFYEEDAPQAVALDRDSDDNESLGTSQQSKCCVMSATQLTARNQAQRQSLCGLFEKVRQDVPESSPFILPSNLSSQSTRRKSLGAGLVSAESSDASLNSTDFSQLYRKPLVRRQSMGAVGTSRSMHDSASVSVSASEESNSDMDGSRNLATQYLLPPSLHRNSHHSDRVRAPVLRSHSLQSDHLKATTIHTSKPSNLKSKTKYQPSKSEGSRNFGQ